MLQRVVLSWYRWVAAVPGAWLVLENADDERIFAANGVGTAARRSVLPGAGVDLERDLVLKGVLEGGAQLDPEPPQEEEARPRPLQEMEKEEIRRALAFTRGHQGHAAELLGISRKALWEKRKRYGIP